MSATSNDKPKKRRMKKSKIDALPKDTSKVKIRVVFEHLRNNQYPEAKTPWELEFDIRANTFTMTNKEEYCKEVLTKQAKYLTDEQMSEFWGKPPRTIKSMREQYKIKKYNTSQSSKPSTS